LKISTAVKDIKRLEGFDMIVRTGLKSWLAVLLDYFKGLIGVVASDLDDHFVSFGIDVTFAWA